MTNLSFGWHPNGHVSVYIQIGEIRDFYHLIGLIEDHLINKAMDMAGGNKTAAAKLLGMKRTSFMERYKKTVGATIEPDKRPTLKASRNMTRRRAKAALKKRQKGGG